MHPRLGLTEDSRTTDSGFKTGQSGRGYELGKYWPKGWIFQGDMWPAQKHITVHPHWPLPVGILIVIVHFRKLGQTTPISWPMAGLQLA